MRALEWRARRNGWRWVVSDTTENVVSANNFIRAGYRCFSRDALGRGPIRCTGENPSNDGWQHEVSHFAGFPYSEPKTSPVA